jgi:hypothetical protein
VNTALRCLLALAAGLTIGLVFGAIFGWLDRDKQARAEHAEIVRKANAALDAIATEVAQEYEPTDFAMWTRELRQRP